MHRKYLVVGLVFTLINLLEGQVKEFKSKGQFYGQLQTHGLFCQIDGDGAAGYNKLGYQFQGTVGFTLNKQESIEWSLGLSERGARKGINPEINDFKIFHIQHQWLESGIFYARWIKGFAAHAGIRVGYLLEAVDSEGYSPYLKNDMRKIHTWAELGFRYPMNEKWSIGMNGTYSIYSLLKNDPSFSLPGSIYQSAGQFSNNIGIGIIYTP